VTRPRSLAPGLTVLLLALPACRPAEAPRPEARHELPAGWWVVEAATLAGTRTGKVGTAWRLLEDELELVGAEDYVDRQRTRLRPLGFPHEWEADQPSHFTVRQTGDILVVNVSGPSPATLVLRAAQPAEADEAERALARHPSIDVACARAAACFREAVQALSTSHDGREMAPGTSLHACEEVRAGYARMFGQLGRPLPAACAPDRD
jgi:hypothetical protein